MKVMGRPKNLCRGSEKTSVLPATFLKVNNLCFYMFKRKNPVQSVDFCEGPRKHRESSGRSWEGHETFMKIMM